MGGMGVGDFHGMLLGHRWDEEDDDDGVDTPADDEENKKKCGE